MKKIILVAILIACSIPAFADDCGSRYKIRMATVLGETIYRVERWEADGVYYIRETDNLRWARFKRDLEIASCRSVIKMKEREEAMKDAKWEEVE